MTKGRFDRKVATITGGASGIGLAIARRFVAEGGQVVANDIDPERVAALQAELAPHGQAMLGDVTREDDVAALFAAAAARTGTIDASFHVAGANRGGYIARMAEADWDFTVDLCLKGVMFAMKHAAQAMLRQGHGAMVNIASLNAHVPMHAGAAYSAAKAGVEMLTKNGALELTPAGIRVNAILPGLVQTPLTRRLFDNPDVHAAFMARIPQGRAAQPEEIAAPALFLASPDASYISGASLLVDGAWAVSGYPDMRPWRN
jgi:meso-butanediol dehydrogenase/(S,S)-butanediol dehydrogenase/diacetyl reductase